MNPKPTILTMEHLCDKTLQFEKQIDALIIEKNKCYIGWYGKPYDEDLECGIDPHSKILCTGITSNGYFIVSGGKSYKHFNAFFPNPQADLVEGERSNRGLPA